MLKQANCVDFSAFICSNSTIEVFLSKMGAEKVTKLSVAFSKFKMGQKTTITVQRYYAWMKLNGV